MESPSGANPAIQRAREAEADEGVVRCPICGSDHTRQYRTDVTDLEYFVVPPRNFVMQKCGECDSEFLTPRPLESELPPSIQATTTPTTRTTAAWLGCWCSSGPGTGSLLWPTDSASPWPHLRCRHWRLPTFRRASSIPRPGMCRHRDPAGCRRKGPGPGLRRPRRHPRDSRPDRPCRTIRHRLHESHPRSMWSIHIPCSSAPMTSFGPEVMSSASCPLCRRGRTDCSATILGRLPLSRGTSRSHPKSGCRSSRRRRLLVGQDKISTAHPDDDLATELARPTWLASSDAQRQDTDLRRPSGRRSSVRNGGLAVRRGRHRQLPGPKRLVLIRQWIKL